MFVPTCSGGDPCCLCRVRATTMWLLSGTGDLRDIMKLKARWPL
jgi:hypothetical protein